MLSLVERTVDTMLLLAESKKFSWMEQPIIRSFSHSVCN